MQVPFDQLRQLWMTTLHHVVLKVGGGGGGGVDKKDLKKQPCFWLGFLPLSEKARSDPVLWLICMQSKYCSSPDTVKSDWGTFCTWGCYGIRFLGPWVILVTMIWRAEPCALHPLPPTPPLGCDNLCSAEGNTVVQRLGGLATSAPVETLSSNLF